MDRRRLFAHPVIPSLLFVFFGLLCALAREFRREVGCYSDVIHLDCGKRSFIAIHEAYFTTDTLRVQSNLNRTCHLPSPEDEYIEDEDQMVTESSSNTSICLEDIRISVNRKCSGNKDCDYSYSQVPDRMCSSPEGVVVVHFDCVQETNLNKYCSTKVVSKEGYITSPGFPQYYPKLSECSWVLTALEGQTILARVLHLQLREASVVRPTPADPDAYYPFGVHLLTEQVVRCEEDRLSVASPHSSLFEVCGEGLDTLKSIELEGGAGEVRFRSAAFMPASGFLLYFKIQGCPTPVDKEGVRLVERNGSVAVYACEDYKVFNDTLENARVLGCLRDRFWNDTLPPCIALEETNTVLASNLNKTVFGATENKTTGGFFEFDFSALIDKNAYIWEDIIIPCIIVGVLVIGNVGIVVMILTFRRRQKYDETEFDAAFEEMKNESAPKAED